VQSVEILEREKNNKKVKNQLKFPKIISPIEPPPAVTKNSFSELSQKSLTGVSSYVVFCNYTNLQTPKLIFQSISSWPPACIEPLYLSTRLWMVHSFLLRHGTEFRQYGFSHNCSSLKTRMASLHWMRHLNKLLFIPFVFPFLAWESLSMYCL